MIEVKNLTKSFDDKTVLDILLDYFLLLAAKYYTMDEILYKCQKKKKCI